MPNYTLGNFGVSKSEGGNTGNVKIDITSVGTSVFFLNNEFKDDFLFI
jgi:hypothetical protein